MKVEVKQYHIVTGDCKKAQKCMIAMAIKEADKDVSYVSVRTNCITVTKRRKNGDSVRRHFAVPLKAARAIIRFDQGELVKPFSFEPKLIDEEVIQQISEKEREASRARTIKRRARLKQEGRQETKYGRLANRIAGV